MRCDFQNTYSSLCSTDVAWKYLGEKGLDCKKIRATAEEVVIWL
jgi:hypothetical protein